MHVLNGGRGASLHRTDACVHLIKSPPKIEPTERFLSASEYFRGEDELGAKFKMCMVQCYKCAF